jgi:hypothetical protein
LDTTQDSFPDQAPRKRIRILTIHHIWDKNPFINPIYRKERQMIRYVRAILLHTALFSERQIPSPHEKKELIPSKSPLSQLHHAPSGLK